MLLEILCPMFLVLGPGDKATLTVFTVGPGAAAPPRITQSILCRVHTEGGFEWPYGLEVRTHTIGKTGEHGVTTSDVDILCGKKSIPINLISTGRPP
jgi:hypothetical protein